MYEFCVIWLWFVFMHTMSIVFSLLIIFQCYRTAFINVKTFSNYEHCLKSLFASILLLLLHWWLVFVFFLHSLGWRFFKLIRKLQILSRCMRTLEINITNKTILYLPLYYSRNRKIIIENPKSRFHLLFLGFFVCLYSVQLEWQNINM